MKNRTMISYQYSTDIYPALIDRRVKAATRCLSCSEPKGNEAVSTIDNYAIVSHFFLRDSRAGKMTRAQRSDFHSGSARTSLALLFLREKSEGLFDPPEMLGSTGLKHMNESYVEQL